MKRKCLSVLILIGLVLLTTAVYAEGAPDTNSPTVNLSEPLYLRYYFSAVEMQAMITSETAFDYVLTNNSAMKDEYYEEMNATEAAIAAFEKANVTPSEHDSTFISGMEDVKKSIPVMKDAAETMFSSFEKDGKINVDDAKAFEEAGDNIIHASDKTWLATMTNLTPPTAYARQRSGYTFLLLAIEESHAYPATANITEKEHALKNFGMFDTVVAKHEGNFTNESFEDLKLSKQNIMDGAEQMFASYEKDGEVNKEDLHSLEVLVEKLVTDYREMNKRLSE
ncbi:hypothetical protein [uncultured Methanospirillum sp.]|uniref:hypothetical protein n=1 Tax=uncultured Methanospirillum sp. TaxID=262503 RepID=UPI0029C9094B|nr:hypothetical protein [uncultured Methanospirillum sp.]